MNLDIFKQNNSDGAFLAYIKREALSRIAEPNTEDTKQYWYDYYKALIDFVNASKRSSVNDPRTFIWNIIGVKDYLLRELPLSPIDITIDGFENIKNSTLQHHKRTFDIVWNTAFKLDEEQSVYYRNAYNLQIRKTFDFIKKEVNENDSVEEQYTIFISKGGVIGGDFIDFVFFHKKDYEKSKMNVPLPINIPVCEVYFKNNKDAVQLIYAVDHREPTLKLLTKRYNCPICNNSEIASYKLNLRNCKSGNHSKKDFSAITFPKPELCKKGNYEAVEENDNVYLKSASGIIAKWKDGHLTIYYNKVRWKKINSVYWTWFTGYGLAYLKNVYNHGNNNITFVY